MEEKFIQGDESRKAIVNAVVKMYSLVGSTMGPAGGTVVIPDSNELGKYKITKDGVSVAKVVKSSNQYEQVIINLIKEVANNTVKVAGDGTTTSIALTASFLLKFLEVANNKEVFTRFDSLLEETIKHLDDTKIKIKQRDIEKVALVSANGDKKIAEMIADAYAETSVVYVEKSNKDEDTLESFKGLYIPGRKITYNTATIDTTVINEPSYVLAIDQTISKFAFIRDIAEKSMKDKRALIIVAHDVNYEVLDIVNMNNRSGKTNIHFIKSPGFSSQRTKLLTDIATYTNAVYVSETETKILPEHVGEIDTVSISKDKSFIYKEDNNISKLIKQLEKELKDAKDDHEEDLLTQRIDRLKGISIIKVGGTSETEVSEKADRYEDAVLAVACALEDGVIEGGGLALAKYAAPKLQELGFDPESRIKNPDILFYLALLNPIETIVSNGANITIESDLLNEGIYDPVKVTKTALTQAYNFVKLLLTTKSIILTHEDYSKFNL